MYARKIAVALSCLVLSICSVAQQYTTNLKVTTQKLSPNVYLIQGEGGNVTAVIDDDGIQLIDTMFPETAANLDAALKAISPKPVRWIFNTHWHADHTGANEYFGSRGATIISSEFTREWMASKGNDFRKDTPKGPMPKSGMPAIAFANAADLTSIAGEHVLFIPLGKGHTDGDFGVYFVNENVAALGDTYFGAFPFRNIVSVQEAFEALVAKLPDDVQVVPGHGAIVYTKDLAEYSAALTDAVKLMRDAIASGKTVEQIKEQKPFAKYERYFPQWLPMDKFVEIAYRELKR